MLLINSAFKFRITIGLCQFSELTSKMSLTQCYFERLFFNDDGGAIGAVVTFHP